MLQIPLTNDPSQVFSIDLNGIVYDLAILYNTREGVWTLNISSSDLTINGISLVTGANLILQHPSLLDSLFLINLSEDLEDPTSTTLAEQFALVTLSADEIQELLV